MKFIYELISIRFVHRLFHLVMTLVILNYQINKTKFNLTFMKMKS